MSRALRASPAAGGKSGVPSDVLLGILDMCLAQPAPGLPSIPMGYARRIAAGDFDASVRAFVAAHALLIHSPWP